VIDGEVKLTVKEAPSDGGDGGVPVPEPALTPA